VVNAQFATTLKNKRRQAVVKPLMADNGVINNYAHLELLGKILPNLLFKT